MRSLKPTDRPREPVAVEEQDRTPLVPLTTALDRWRSLATRGEGGQYREAQRARYRHFVHQLDQWIGQIDSAGSGERATDRIL